MPAAVDHRAGECERDPNWNGYDMIRSLVFALLPSRLKVSLLRKRGAVVGRNVYIGFSVLDADEVTIEDDCYIGHGNVISGLRRFRMGTGSKINRWNRIASARIYTKSEFLLGERSSISLRHYLDVCDRFEIGSDTIIAGHRSTFFTHSKGVDVIDYTKPIIIGSWCYVGSNVSVAPGARLGSHCFLGMGSVLVGDQAELTHRLLAGNPARVVRELNPNASYFTQGPLRHRQD